MLSACFWAFSSLGVRQSMEMSMFILFAEILGGGFGADAGDLEDGVAVGLGDEAEDDFFGRRRGGRGGGRVGGLLPPQAAKERASAARGARRK